MQHPSCCEHAIIKNGETVQNIHEINQSSVFFQKLVDANQGEADNYCLLRKSTAVGHVMNAVKFIKRSKYVLIVRIEIKDVKLLAPTSTSLCESQVPT